MGRAPRAPQWPLHGAEAHGDRLPIRVSDLATGDLQYPYADLPILVAYCAPRRRNLLVRPRFDSRWGSRTFRRIFQGDAAIRDRLATYSLHVHHHLGLPRRDLFAGLPLHPLDGRFTGAVPLARAQGRSPHVQNEYVQRHPETVDLDHHWTVPAGARWHALPPVWRFRVRHHVQPRPGGCYCRLPGILRKWMFHEHARLWRRALQAAAPRHAPELLRR